ncbi:uncharacterized protein [Lepeophtheirus salmonis]|uniref:Female cement gland membrane bound 1 n=3 Tax=Lepeophtheirus salmonis TaxID=72036 RepID=A0A649ZUD7_LEPSM|nr:prolow-density lipoprotein receptor-related protein 1-like [Lepeophtheirus salmonis]QGN01376.1 female cement gland membrane bound 1 [Lepeophtheirus salmonis]
MAGNIHYILFPSFVYFLMTLSSGFGTYITGSHPTFCPESPMASLCEQETQQECPKDRDITGCFHGYYCLPRWIYHNLMKCPLVCPPLCEEHEMFCPGSMVDECPTEDNCVAKIDENNKCPNYCPITCEKGQHICPGIRKDDGCRGPDTCVPIGTQCPSEIFDEFACPIIDSPSCVYPETHCHGGYNSRGCRKRSFCKELKNKTEHQHGVNGIDGCPTFCPATCIPGIETECPETYDEDGCPLPASCSKFLAHCPDSSFEPGTGCPVVPSKNCTTTNKQTCHNEPMHKSIIITEFRDEYGYSEYLTIFLNQTLTIDDPICDMGHFCVDRSDSDEGCPIHCPVYCNNNTQKSCPGVLDDDGCLGQGMCVSIAESCPISQYDLDGCFVHGAINCDPEYEISCPGVRDQRGCIGRESCVPKHGDCSCPKEEFDHNGCLLEVSEPICNSTEIQCSRGKSAKGCDLGFDCSLSIIDGCPNHCSPHCDENKQACPIISPHTGAYANCSTTEGYECVDLYDSKGCTQFCSNHCTKIGLLTCPPIYNGEGCPTGPAVCTTDLDQCAPSTFNLKGCKKIKQLQNCSYYETGDYEGSYQLCSGGTDSHGCPRLNTCEPTLTPEGHPFHCPVVCQQNELSCSRGTFNSISMGEFCIPADAHYNFMPNMSCATFCPAACDWSIQKACSGGYNKMTGCPHQDICIPKHKYCNTFPSGSPRSY